MQIKASDQACQELKQSLQEAQQRLIAAEKSAQEAREKINVLEQSENEAKENLEQRLQETNIQLEDQRVLHEWRAHEGRQKKI